MEKLSEVIVGGKEITEVTLTLMVNGGNLQKVTGEITLDWENIGETGWFNTLLFLNDLSLIITGKQK